MTVRIIVTARARRNIGAIDKWWKENRIDAQELFAQEFFDGVDGLSKEPHLGSVYQSRGREYRRWLLPRTRFHSYYRAHEEGLAVVAVWSAQRPPPKL